MDGNAGGGDAARAPEESSAERQHLAVVVDNTAKALNGLAKTITAALMDVRREIKDLKDELARVSANVQYMARNTVPPAEMTSTVPSTQMKPTPATRFEPTATEQIIVENLTLPQGSAEPFSKWAMNVSVLSIVEQFSVLGSWMNEQERQGMGAARKLVRGVSGFSVLFFSKSNTDSLKLYSSPPGQLWTFVVRASFSLLIFNRRAQMYSRDKALPDWLAEFGDMKQIVRIVDSRLRNFDAISDMDMSTYGTSPKRDNRNPKRRRTEDGVMQTCPERVQCLHRLVLQGLKSRVLKHYTHNRACGKLYLFEHLLFIVEAINGYGGTAAARERGCFVIFPVQTEDEKLPERGSLPLCSAWRLTYTTVPTACTGTAEADDLNQDLFMALKDCFPSYNLELNWKKSVIPSGECDLDTSNEDYGNLKLVWDEELVVNLHDVAAGLLVETMKYGSKAALLRSSMYSLMTVHILATGMRGLLQEHLGYSPTNVESAAKAYVHCLYHRKNNPNVSVMQPNAEAECWIPTGFEDVAIKQPRDEPSAKPRRASKSSKDKSSMRSGSERRTKSEEHEKMKVLRKQAFTLTWNEYLERKHIADAEKVRISQSIEDSNVHEDELLPVMSDNHLAELASEDQAFYDNMTSMGMSRDDVAS